jgi:uncharacterized protein (TIGR02452 family)
MSKISSAAIAERTLDIIKNKKINNVDISDQLLNNINNTITINPADFEKVLSTSLQSTFEEQQIIVENSTTIAAITKYQGVGKIGVLNFASAKNPGGGFLGGAIAQEESLARSSSLYASLISNTEMYECNKKIRSYIYTNYAIYSPNTLFWFNDEGSTLSEIAYADVITMPAPNKGAMLQHNRRDEIAQIDEVFKKRIEFVLKIAQQHNIDVIILGAWGCGVFRNEVNDVANYFKQVITAKNCKAFKKIVFAIYDSSEKKNNYNTFKSILTL